MLLGIFGKCSETSGSPIDVHQSGSPIDVVCRGHQLWRGSSGHGSSIVVVVRRSSVVAWLYVGRRLWRGCTSVVGCGVVVRRSSVVAWLYAGGHHLW